MSEPPNTGPAVHGHVVICVAYRVAMSEPPNTGPAVHGHVLWRLLGSHE